MSRDGYKHVTVITPGHRASAVRSKGNTRVPQTFAEGVELVTTPEAQSTGRAWDGPLHEDAIEEASAQGAEVYVRGVDCESMADAIEQEGYMRKPEEEI